MDCSPEDYPQDALQTSRKGQTDRQHENITLPAVGAGDIQTKKGRTEYPPDRLKHHEDVPLCSSDTTPVSPGGSTSSTLPAVLQRLQPLNVPRELFGAAETLWKYYEKRHTSNDLKQFYKILEEEICRSAGAGAGAGAGTVAVAVAGTVAVAGNNSKKPSYSRAVKVHSVTAGKTFGADEALLNQVNNPTVLLLERTDWHRSRVVILFCPISTRVGSDVELAMSRMPGDKDIILVVMHHTRKVDYSTSGTKWSDSLQNVVLDVDVLFHESMQGLLTCSRNQNAVREIQQKLLQYSSISSCSSSTTTSSSSSSSSTRSCAIA